MELKESLRKIGIEKIAAAGILLVGGGTSVASVAWINQYFTGDIYVKPVCGEKTADVALYFGDTRAIVIEGLAGKNKLAEITVGGQLNKPHDPGNPAQGGEFYLKKLRPGTETKIEGPIGKIDISDPEAEGVTYHVDATSGGRMSTHVVVRTECIN